MGRNRQKGYRDISDHYTYQLCRYCILFLIILSVYAFFQCSLEYNSRSSFQLHIKLKKVLSMEQIKRNMSSNIIILSLSFSNLFWGRQPCWDKLMYQFYWTQLARLFIQGEKKRWDFHFQALIYLVKKKKLKHNKFY